MSAALQDSFVISATAEAILTKASLSSVLQVYADDRKSTSLTVKNGFNVGKIHLCDGMLIHAEFSQQIGDAAFLEIAKWEKPELIIVDRLRSEAHSVQQPLHSLLLEAARLLDEGHKQAAPKAPTTTAKDTPGANLRTLLQALLRRPQTKGILILDYSNGQVLMKLGEIKSAEVLVEFYISLVKASKQVALIRDAQRSLELSLVMGDEQHLLVFPVSARGICVVHIGSLANDHKALSATLEQVARNFR